MLVNRDENKIDNTSLKAYHDSYELGLEGSEG